METLLIHKFIQWTITGRTISTSNALSPIQCIWHLEQCFCIQCELMFTSMKIFTQLQLVEALVATNISYNLIIDRVTIQFLLKLEWLSYFFQTWSNGPILQNLTWLSYVFLLWWSGQEAEMASWCCEPTQAALGHQSRKNYIIHINIFVGMLRYKILKNLKN